VEYEKIMSEESENACEVTVEEALQMESIFSQALMDVIVAKGLITSLKNYNHLLSCTGI